MSTTNADSLLRGSAFGFAGMARYRISLSEIAACGRRGACTKPAPILFRGSAFFVVGHS